ncbi:MAG: GlsB/YeaQ/YmgE family stress response membrane protein [Alphaproteobacteria bacterium]
MDIISWLVLGLIAGLIAKFLIPGDDPGGIIVTVLVGAAGGFLGGIVARTLGLGDVDGVNLGSLVVAVVGAFVLLIALRIIMRKRA